MQTEIGDKRNRFTGQTRRTGILDTIEKFEGRDARDARAAHADRAIARRVERRERHRRFNRPFAWASKRIEERRSHIQEAIFSLALIMIGVIAAGYTGQWWFFFGFFSMCIYVIFPRPVEPYQAPNSIISLGIFNPLSNQHNAHTGYAFVRSFLKVSVIFCFAMGFSNLGTVFNIAKIATVFIGYFLLKSEYDNHAEFLEALLKFGVLGCYFIPFNVFAPVFNSMVLMVLALAFFAVPPMPSAKSKEMLSPGLSGIYAYWGMFEKFIFIGFMGVALLGAIGFPSGAIGLSSGWALTGTLSATFIYFWVICFIGGLFSPPQERPVTGMIMLVAATIIYGIGPGSQDIGAGLMGQWWPSVHNGFSAISEPIAEALSGITDTFGNAISMITNPIGYAQQIMDGSYQKTKGTDKVGAFGVEIKELKLGSYDFALQPAISVGVDTMILASILNQGGSDAEDVEMAFIMGEDPLGAERPQGMTISDIVNSGYCDSNGTSDNICIKYVGGTKPNTLGQMQQSEFSLIANIDCNTIEKYSNANVREKVIPVTGVVKYKYVSESALNIEFNTREEWTRRVMANKEQQIRKPSSLSTAPAKLSIDTMAQPITAGTNFHIGVNLKSAEGDQSAITDAVVTINYPKEFGKPKNEGCGGSALIEESPDKKTWVVKWSIIGAIKGVTGTNANAMEASGRNLYCYFLWPASGMLSGPSKTYTVKASAKYNFLRWKTANSKIAFTDYCCKDNDCGGKGKVCNRPNSAPTGVCNTQSAVSCSQFSEARCMENSAACKWINGKCYNSYVECRIFSGSSAACNSNDMPDCVYKNNQNVCYKYDDAKVECDDITKLAVNNRPKAERICRLKSECVPDISTTSFTCSKRML